MRPFATLFISLVMALGAIGLAVAAPGGADRELANAQLQASSGAVSIANSRAGQAVFNATALRPGEGVSGTVTIGNDGDVAGTFAVDDSGVHDVPGPNGGLLSERVELVLFDVTDVQNPVTVFAGTPADFEKVALGRFAPGEEREYLFAAELPVAADNTFQGASLSLGFEWSASSVAPATTPAPPTATPAPPTATPAPTTPVVTPPATSIADILGLPAATTCVKKGKLKLRLKAPKGTKIVSATVKVNNRTKARLKGKKVRKPVQLRGLGAKPAKITVAVKASNRKTYTATRTYVGCK
jgi:spore coat-associated protein N